MYRSLFSRDLFAELDRLQREMHSAFDFSPAIRGFGRSGYPALNVGTTPQAVEVFAFAPGMDPATIAIEPTAACSPSPVSARPRCPPATTRPPSTSTSGPRGAFAAW